MERRQVFTRKVCELATQCFITDDKPNVSGLILAGCADFKTCVVEDERFDPRLAPKVLKVIDTSYGGENGLNQAIELAADCMKGQKFQREKQVMSKFFEHISLDTHMTVYGVEDTMRALEAGSLETICIFEGNEYVRMTLRNKDTDGKTVVYCKESD